MGGLVALYPYLSLALLTSGGAVGGVPSRANFILDFALWSCSGRGFYISSTKGCTDGIISLLGYLFFRYLGVSRFSACLGHTG